jgi:hypothetical protein
METGQAARVLEVSPEMVRIWCRSGVLSYTRTLRGTRLRAREQVLALKAQRDEARASIAAARSRRFPVLPGDDASIYAQVAAAFANLHTAED